MVDREDYFGSFFVLLVARDSPLLDYGSPLLYIKTFAILFTLGGLVEKFRFIRERCCPVFVKCVTKELLSQLLRPHLTSSP